MAKADSEALLLDDVFLDLLGEALVELVEPPQAASIVAKIKIRITGMPIFGRFWDLKYSNPERLN